MRGSLSRSRGCTLAAVLTILYLIPAPLSAQATDQAATQRAAAAAKSTPRLPDGHPDLSGVWGGGGGRVVVDSTGGKHIGIASRSAPKSEDPDGKLARYYLQVDGDRRRAANPNKPPYKEELLAKVHDLDKGENRVDPVVSCHPAGVPRAFPSQIFATPNYLVFFYTGENSSHYRLIPADGSVHPKDAYPTYFGDSVAHWEKDTLVVDVTNFNDQTWLGSDGWFHTDAMHVVERFTREGNVLHYQATVEDSNVFTRPWLTDPRTALLNSEPNNYVFEEFPCMDFDHDHIVNHDHF